MTDIQGQIAQYQHFLTSVLTPRLEEAVRFKEELLQEVTDIERLQSLIKTELSKAGVKHFETLVSIGDGLQCQAQATLAEDVSEREVFLNVGLGFHVPIKVIRAVFSPSWSDFYIIKFTFLFSICFQVEDAPEILSQRLFLLESKLEAAQVDAEKVVNDVEETIKVL